VLEIPRPKAVVCLSVQATSPIARRSCPDRFNFKQSSIDARVALQACDKEFINDNSKNQRFLATL
ncbi:MAG: hypothetical protein O2948_13845, partial [Proteobacteria bacterium]|nr:hypothetical protein [Pseudomonadota bacterium]